MDKYENIIIVIIIEKLKECSLTNFISYIIPW